MRVMAMTLAIGLALGLPAATEARPAHGDNAAPGKARAPSRWIIVFEEPPAAAFRGFAPDARRPKLSPTSPAATGARRYDARSAAARDYVRYLADLRATRLSDIAARLGRAVTPDYVYAHATNGVALVLSPADAAAIAGLPGVKSVSPEFQRYPQTNTSMPWIGADDVWSGAVPGVAANKGAGVVVGVIDGGINRFHTAFSGAGIANPRAQVYGWCAVSPTACNSKLIGLWNFVGAGDGMAEPVDEDGHGTHTASTAVGKAFLSLSGVAPHANLIAYKACGGGTCPGAALVGAIDQAVADGVDVINYSIGFQPTDPWLGVPSDALYDDAEAFLAAREAGIVIAVAAGNQGPEPGSHTKPGNAPWVIGVANGTDDDPGAPAPDVLVPSSGRGPVVPFGVVKPDVAAPGIGIAAAGISGPTSIAVAGGTSMSSPHVAGTAALVLSTNPGATVDQVVSAITLTARNGLTTAPGAIAYPHEQGNGMIDAAKAVRAGLYLPIADDAFRAASAEPFASGASPLNLPSFGHGACFRVCTMTRTLASMPGAPDADYTVATATMTPGATIAATPTVFPGRAGGATLAVTVDVRDPALLDTWVYGWVTLVDTSAEPRPSLRLPVAVYATPYADAATEAALAGITHDAAGERGFFDVAVGGTVELPDARFAVTALATAVDSVEAITVDATPLDPYAGLEGTYRRLITVPASATATNWRIAVSTRAEGTDIDLYLGHDADGDGLPEAGELACMSATPGGDEDCVIDVTHAAPTTYWLVAQNYDGPGTGVAVSSHALGLDAATTPALTATGPGHVADATPFHVRVAYDDPSMLPGERRVGLLYLQRAPGETVVSVPFAITRTGNAPSPFGLAPGVARAVTLPAGAAHEHLYVDLPPGTTQATFRTQGTGGDVSLHAAHVALPAGPVVAAAPPRAAATHSQAGAGADRTIIVANPAAGRWYLTPVNDGSSPASIEVSATIDSVDAVPPLRRGSYYNPARGGHGVFVYPSGGDHALLWYTYLQDGSPTWYYAQGPLPGADQVWRGTVYRAAWHGTSRTLDAIGDLVLTPRADGQLSMTYNIDGFTGAETLDTFLTGCPTHGGAPLDVSAHWFDAASPGYGYSVQVNPGYEFLATFVYDAMGVPRFLAAERAGPFAGGDPTVPLYQLRGFAPLGPYAVPARTGIGQLTRAYGVATIQTIGANAAFVDDLPGTWARTASVTRLSELTQGCAD